MFPALILESQNCFSTEEGYEELLKFLNDNRVAESLRSKWEDNPKRSSTDKWSDVLRAANKQPVRGLSFNMSFSFREFTYLPRL